MKAVCWNGVNNLSVERVPDPSLLNPHDAIVRVKLSSVCGSDLHLLDGYVPTMKPGDIIGHEFLGEVVEVGPEVKNHRPGDRVVVVSIIGCGECWFCTNQMWSCCDNSNPKPRVTETLYGKGTAGIFGYAHAFGGYAGSHAEYIRVPFIDHGAFKVPEGVPDESAVFVSDAVPTGYMAADMGNIFPGDTVAVWGCGGVGLMAMHAARVMGAERIIAIDRFPERIALARDKAQAETINYEEVDVHEALEEFTGGRGPDVCIDAVGTEAHGTGPHWWYDRVKSAAYLATDRPYVLRQAIEACRKGGTVSVVGVYGGLIDKFPMGAVVNKGLTVRSGQQHGQKFVKRIFEDIGRGAFDPGYLLTHKWPLDRAPEGYQMFKKKTDDCVRVVFAP